MIYQAIQYLFVIVLTSILYGCNSEGLPSGSEETMVNDAGFLQKDKWWDVPSPDLLYSSDKP